MTLVRAKAELKDAVRQFQAWDSICQESETLNLDAFQHKQSQTKRDSANKSVEALIPETYIWLLVPDQPDPRQPDELQEFKLQPQPQVTLTSTASRRLRNEEMLITQYAGTLLRSEMDRIPLWKGNHVSIKDLSEYFARYVYLPRLKNSEVLFTAIREGLQSDAWERETFAYADRWDADANRYIGLKVGQAVSFSMTTSNVLVKPEVARAQLAADEAEAQRKASEAMAYTTYTASAPTRSAALEPRGTTSTSEPSLPSASTQSAQSGELPASPVPVPLPVGEPRIRRFHGSVKINSRQMAKDAGKIMDEVVMHLTSSNPSKDGVEVTLEIQAELPNGIAADTMRAVLENIRQLKFEHYGFEEE